MVSGDNIKITGLVASLVVVTGLIMGVTNYTALLGDAYDKDSSTFENRMQSLNHKDNVSRQIQVAEDRSQRTGNAITAGVYFLSNIANTIKITFEAVTTIVSMVYQAQRFLGLPPFLIYIIDGIISIIVSFGIVRIYKGVRA